LPASGRHAAVDGGLQQHLFDLVRGDAVVARGADVQLELFVVPQRHHHHDGQQRAGVTRQAVAGPHRAPCGTGDEVLEFVGEVGARLQRALDVGLAEYGAAHGQAGFVAFLLVHWGCLVLDGMYRPTVGI
jgi:hypothetical protein